MKKILVLLLALFALFILVACGNSSSQITESSTEHNQSSICSHSWEAATCAAPKTCKTCGATEGSAVGHSWETATCTAPKTCKTCGATEGSAAGHSWTDATCTAPKTCKICGATEGSAAGHSWTDATCTAAKTCKTCGTTEGGAAGHSWNNATSTASKTCKTCGATEGGAAGHSWTDVTCTAPKTCKTCGATEGSAAGHSWTDATCTAPKTCKICGATEGSAAGHSWTDATCTAAKTCKVCGATEGGAAGHSWNDATCTAPKTCKICGAAEGSAAGHSWNNATCTASKTCKTCGATEDSAVGHSWNNATCTASKTCKTCGATEGSAAGHSWNNATCTAPKTCKTCGATEGKATGHSWNNATCTAPKTCGVCGTTEGDVNDHNWKEISAGSQEPNCLVEGFIYYECTLCSDSKTEDLGYGDHTYGEWKKVKEPTCTEEGLESRVCKYAACRHEETRSIDAYGAHNYDKSVVTPTCTEKGYTMHVCSCGDYYTDKEVAAKGHSWGEWKDSSGWRNPCTEDGIECRTCENCYAQEEQAIKAAHSYEEGYCTRCDARDANYAFVYIDFKDKLFEAYIKQALGFETEDKVATVDMKKLTDFTIQSRVSDVEELKYATNLKSITIEASNVSNLDVLSYLPITYVHLGYNGGITEIDVSFMKNLKEVTEVHFYDCKLTGGSMKDVVSSPKLTYYDCFINYVRNEVDHSIDYLAKAQNVTRLRLWNIFSDTDISVLLTLPKIKGVEIYDSGRITEQHNGVIDQLIIRGIVVDVEF